MRLFVGIAVGDAVKDALERLTLRLRAQDDGLRWSTRDQWHVTLVFLGEVNDEARARLVRELATVRQPPIALQIDHLGVFTSAGILHAAVEVTPAQQRLHERWEATEFLLYRSQLSPAGSRYTVLETFGLRTAEPEP